MKPRVAFVVQRYGEDLTGGSEALCRAVAERMSKHFSVDVLTTCATDHLSWKNVLPPGESELNGVRVKRFPVDGERRLLEFHSVYDYILTRQLTRDEEEQMLRHQGPYCPALVDHVRQRAGEYDAFVVFTYMYWPQIHVLPLIKDKVVFVPTAHDEANLYLHTLDEVFRAPKRMAFLTEEERFLVLRRFTLPESVGDVVGMGIDEPASGNEDQSNWKTLKERLAGKRALTYVGRVENGKGCDELVEFFLRFTEEERASDLLLLLIGKRTLPLPPHPQIQSTGFVSDFVKYHALANSTVAVAPSPFESFCIAALESWTHKLPLLANGRCDVTVGHCARSDGGLWYSNYSEFRQTLRLLLSDDQLRTALGKQGSEYVDANYRWPVVEERWRAAIERALQ